jgi:hypothetical protein
MRAQASTLRFCRKCWPTKTVALLLFIVAPWILKEPPIRGGVSPTQEGCLRSHIAGVVPYRNWRILTMCSPRFRIHFPTV